jgi:hypothetical protein
MLLNHLYAESRMHASAAFENAVISTANRRLTTVLRRPGISAALADYKIGYFGVVLVNSYRTATRSGPNC